MNTTSNDRSGLSASEEASQDDAVGTITYTIRPPEDWDAELAEAARSVSDLNIQEQPTSVSVPNLRQESTSPVRREIPVNTNNLQFRISNTSEVPNQNLAFAPPPRQPPMQIVQHKTAEPHQHNNNRVESALYKREHVVQARPRTFYVADEKDVPKAALGYIIGKSGSKITGIQERTATTITHTRHRYEEYGTFHITGREADVQRAKAEIDAVLTKFDNMIKEQEARGDPPWPRPRSDAALAFPQSVAAAATVDPFGTAVPAGTQTVVEHQQASQTGDEPMQSQGASFPQIIKTFYQEHPEVAAWDEQTVDRLRHAKNDITVSRVLCERFGGFRLPEYNRAIPNPVVTFYQAFACYPGILHTLQRVGFKRPTPIQCQAWPILLSGEDMIGIAQTGTGKTLAYLLPALVHIVGQLTPRNERKGPTVLIFAPTRELAQQIYTEVNKYSYEGIRSVCLYGKGDRAEQLKMIRSGVEIVVATPGRLNDFIKSDDLDPSNFSYVVIDEADRMLDMGFGPQINLSMHLLPPNHQTVLTSATWPPCVQRIVYCYTRNPIQVIVGSLDLATVHSVEQRVIVISNDINTKFEVLLDIIKGLKEDEKAMVFCDRKAKASHIGTDLMLKNVMTACMHGDCDQVDREQSLSDFKYGNVQVLVATDLASRGIDIYNVTHVINFDFPRNIEEYVHRVGRTGRAGLTGIAITFFSAEDRFHAHGLINILKEAGQVVPPELIAIEARIRRNEKRRVN